MKRFENRTVIVTGGARGMGASHARGFIEEAHLEAIVAEIERLRGRLAAAHTQQQLAVAFEAQIRDAELLLARFRDRLDAMELTKDMGAKRELVQLYVSRIRNNAEVVGGGRKDARITINYALAGWRSFAGFSIGTPITEPYSVQEPS